eukprot:364974-Chlamydomonas_euryale.AAC.5
MARAAMLARVVGAAVLARATHAAMPWKATYRASRSSSVSVSNAAVTRLSFPCWIARLLSNVTLLTRSSLALPLVLKASASPVRNAFALRTTAELSSSPAPPPTPASISTSLFRTFPPRFLRRANTTGAAPDVDDGPSAAACASELGASATSPMLASRPEPGFMTSGLSSARSPVVLWSLLLRLRNRVPLCCLAASMRAARPCRMLAVCDVVRRTLCGVGASAASLSCRAELLVPGSGRPRPDESFCWSTAQH